MNFDIRKTVTDTGYVAVGIGVLAFQRAQVRRRELQQRLASSGGCLEGLRARIEPVVGQMVGQVVGQVVEQVGDRVKTVVNRAA